MESVINDKRVRLNLRTGEIFMQNHKFKDTRWMVRTPRADGNGYLQMNIGYRSYKLHRVIYKIWNPDWNIDDGSQDNSIDHINGHTDDNRIANLRNVTNQQNQWNQTKAKGYYWYERLKKWVAQICVSRKVIHLGLFDLEADARNAYLEAKKIYHIITEM